MKKIISVALMLCLVLSLCACGAEENTPAPTEAPVVVTEAPTEAPAETEAAIPEGMVTYTVTVVDEEGNPISGAMVQICMDACIPAVTNEEGVAEWTVEEADYKVSFLTAPAGFAADTENYYFESGSTEMTLTLKAAE